MLGCHSDALFLVEPDVASYMNIHPQNYGAVPVGPIAWGGAAGALCEAESWPNAEGVRAKGLA